MESDTEEFIAIAEFQCGKPERFRKYIKSRAGKPLSPFLADFLATLPLPGKMLLKRGVGL